MPPWFAFFDEKLTQVLRNRLIRYVQSNPQSYQVYTVGYFLITSIVVYLPQY
jgi:hypothetical protein